MDTSGGRPASSRKPVVTMVWTWGLVLASSLVALGLTVWLRQYLQYTPLAVLYGAVFFSSRMGGVVAGGAATLITTVLARWVVLPVVLPGGWRAEEFASLGIYALLCVATVAYVNASRKRRAALREKEEQLARAEAERGESEQRFRALFERSPEAMFILDPHDAERLLPIVDCNEIGCRQHGYACAEVLGQPLSLLDGQIRSRADLEELLQRLRRLPVIETETSHRHKDGRAFCVESRVSLIVSHQREFLLGMFRDISARKEAEENVRHLKGEFESRVRERTQQLEQANRELEAFSYSISHDLRAPVRAINGFTQIIRNDHSAHLSGEVARLFQVIGSNAERMGELIDDLLAFSHLSVRELSCQTVNMTALAQSVVAELGHGMARESARFRLHKLPVASGDSSMLRQVLTNLIGNALKFSREAAQPCVEIGAWREERRLVYFVRDNGIGFNMKHASKLFKVFQRLHGSGKFEGTGVGLAIVQRIVQRHGGEVWAESLPGAGATFFFSLPGENVLVQEPAQSPAPLSEGVCF